MSNTLKCRAFADIKPAPLRWLVEGYFPQGKLTMIAGDGGHGKSTLTLHLAACLTTGRPALGLDYNPPPPADVLLVNCEDDAADTVLPRLLAAGADMARVHQVEGVKDQKGNLAPFSLQHFDALQEKLSANPNIKMIVVDPVGGFIGGVNDHKDSEVRALLAPLADLASSTQSSMQLVKHLNKGSSLKAVDKVGGSAGYVNSVRAAFIVAPDPENRERKLFLPLKFNLGRTPLGLAFRLQDLSACQKDQLIADHIPSWTPEDKIAFGKMLVKIEWLGEVAITADELIAKLADGSSYDGDIVTDRERVIGLAKHGTTLGITYVKTMTGWSYDKTTAILGKMSKDGQLIRTDKGLYQLPAIADDDEMNYPHNRLQR